MQLSSHPMRIQPAAIILFERERDMPHGFFGDRDARHTPQERRRPPACGLFGRLGNDPPLRPANDSPAATPRPPHTDA